MCATRSLRPTALEISGGIDAAGPARTGLTEVSDEENRVGGRAAISGASAATNTVTPCAVVAWLAPWRLVYLRQMFVR
jgi:hypothetical protein